MTILSLVLAGCGFGGGGTEKKNGNGGGPSGKPQANAKPIGTAPLATRHGKARTELLSLDRGTNNTATVRFRIVNEGDKAFSLLNALSAPRSVNSSADGTTLIDTTSNKRYFPLVGADGKCLCTYTNSVRLQPNQPVEMFAIFPAPPADLKNIGVSVHLTPMFPNVPIGNGPAPAPPGATVDVTKPTQPPKILPLTATVEGDEQDVDEDGDNQSIRLSADVLFAVNKAALTPKAKSLLVDVAKQVDQSQGTTVKVDGHADNTGNDAINEPLSQRRALAVEGEIKKLVTRKGLTYQSTGHGSKQPIAENNTQEGRTKNRRVTVSFAKPAPPEPSSAPPAAPATPAPAGGPVATAQPDEPDVQNVKADIMSVKRDASGLVTVVWTLTNNGSENLLSLTRFSNAITNIRYFRGDGSMGLTLRDEGAAKRYYTLRDSDRHCVCSDVTPGGFSYVKAGEKNTYFNAFKLPADVKNVTVEIPEYQPVQNVPIS